VHRRGPRDGNDCGETVLTKTKPTTLVLVRHGTTPTTGKELPGRAAGLSLSELGRAEAERTAHYLRISFDSIAAVYSSPLERTSETAQLIAGAFGKKVVPTDELLELDCGSWTGEKLSTVTKRREWKDLMSHASTFRFPEGETFNDVLARMRSFLSGVAVEFPGETVIAVSHADPIRAVVTDALGLHLDQVHRVNISPASVTLLIAHEGYPRGGKR
jgi:Fructose-2,6-bisphosphatase